MSKRVLYSVLSIGVTLLTTLVLVFPFEQGSASHAQIPFQHFVIDDHPPSNQESKTVGDINGDGFADVITSSSSKGGMVWYEYPKWDKHTIDPGGSFTTDMQAADIDRDGDSDVVVPQSDSKEVRWYENPRPSGDPATASWKAHFIVDYAKLGFDYAHDVEVGDLNGDGKLDVVICNQKWEPPRPVNKPETLILFQNQPDSWTSVLVSRTYGEGTIILDVNGDGRPDILRPGFWLEAPRDPVHDNWVEHAIIPGWPDRAGVAAADVNQDGHLDILFAPAESAGRLSWFETTEPAKGKWTEHLIDPSIDFVHTFKVADIDMDGSPDVVFAEMQQSARKRVGFFLNRGKASKWELQVVGAAGSHNLRVIDIDQDGDIDIVGANWNSETDPHHAPIELWRNLLADQRKSVKR
jgi:hypothetical protein